MSSISHKLHIIDYGILIHFVRNRLRYHLERILLWFNLMHGEGVLYSIYHVKNELQAGNDRLVTWATDDAEIFNNEDPVPEILINRVKMVAWKEGTNRGLSIKKIINFNNSADVHVIAHAMFTGACVVTSEISKQQGKLRIPDICKQLEIECIDLNQFLDRLGYTFLLIHKSQLERALPLTV